jgi:hypothetical protein
MAMDERLMMGLISSKEPDEAVEGRERVTGSLLAWLRRHFHGGFAGMGKARSERRLQLVETLQLGGKRQLMLVLCDGQLVLVGAGGDSIHSIAEMRSQPETGPR